MPRQPRRTPADTVFHVINRGVGRRTLFHKPQDYDAFEGILAEAHERVPVRILAYCLMPNHWHFVLWPHTDTQVAEFTKWMTHTHTQRYHAHYHSAGTGHLYQGRYKSFPVQKNLHLLLVLRYVERNPLRGRLVERAEQWMYSSLWRRENQRGCHLLADWPLERPPDWRDFVNEPQSDDELAALRDSVQRGSPFGDDAWRLQIAHDLDIEPTLRPRGRPPSVVSSANDNHRP